MLLVNLICLMMNMLINYLNLLLLNYQLIKLIIFNNVVDVACKFDIFNSEYVVKLLIYNMEFVERPFKLVVIAYPDKSGLFGIAL